MGLVPLEQNELTYHVASELWTRACGENFALPPRAFAYNLRASRDAMQHGQFAVVNGEHVGFVLASVFDGDEDVAPHDLGWMDVLIVAPEFQQRGVGTQLLNSAEEWLRAHGRTRIRVGGGLRPFAPGVPGELGTDFLRAHGFEARDENPIVQDFGHDLQHYVSPKSLHALNVVCRPANEKEVDALRKFLAREFPGRWLYEFEQHLRDGARIADYFVLESERGIDACCLITLPDSLRPVEHFYPLPLPRPWGQAGSIGVSADRRNAGYGSALLDTGLRYLRDKGVRGCIIDWTHHVGYYERFGFRPHRKYEMLVKHI